MPAVVAEVAATVEAAAAFTGVEVAGFTEAGCTPDASTAAVATVAVGVRHIPSRAARGVPDMAVVTQSQVGPVMATAEGIIVADMVLQRSELLRPVPRIMAAAITTTTATTRTVIGSVPGILIEPR
jgi:hypothetical protein